MSKRRLCVGSGPTTRGTKICVKERKTDNNDQSGRKGFPVFLLIWIQMVPGLRLLDMYTAGLVTVVGAVPSFVAQPLERSLHGGGPSYAREFPCVNPGSCRLPCAVAFWKAQGDNCSTPHVVGMLSLVGCRCTEATPWHWRDAQKQHLRGERELSHPHQAEYFSPKARNKTC